MVLELLTSQLSDEMHAIVDKVVEDKRELQSWISNLQPSSEVRLEFMSNLELANRCMYEIERFRHSEPSDERYGVGYCQLVRKNMVYC